MQVLWGILTLFALIAGPVAAEVVCDVFEIHAEINDGTLTYSLNSDLPPEATVMLTVERRYMAGEELAIYFDDGKSTVGELASDRVVDVSHERWERLFKKERDKLRALNLYGEFQPASDEISVRLVVPINQDELFGKKNELLTGAKVTEDGIGRLVRAEKHLPHPLTGEIIDSRRVAHTALLADHWYQTDDDTPMMSNINPDDSTAALARTRVIPSGVAFRVVRRVERRGELHYEVEARDTFALFDEEKRREDTTHSGFVFSDALIGRKVEHVDP